MQQILTDYKHDKSTLVREKAWCYHLTSVKVISGYHQVTNFLKNLNQYLQNYPKTIIWWNVAS